MREKKKSGLFCCGQNSKKLRFYRGAMAVVSGLSLVGGLVLFSVVAQAAICFLPDCQDKPMKFEPSGVEQCLAAGYESTSSRICPPNSNIERCPENSSYIKCNLRQWCLDNGYTIVPDDCQVPQYADAQCPNGEVLYFQCKEDLEKACLEEDNDYVSDCQDGWTLDDTELCSYSDLYGKCCNLCADYPYEADEIPQGYQTGGSCLACGNVTRYQKELNDCAAQGFIQCDKGGQTGTEVCWRGDEKWYKECCAPCDDYPYLESQIPEGYVKGDSCDSCDGMKYKTKVGECASGYEWKDGACVACDETCSVGNILYSDYTCSSCNVSGKTAIGVISYASGSTRLAIQLNNLGYMYWSSSNYTDISGITNYDLSSTAKNDFSGKANTAAWVSYYGSSTSSYAPGYCYNYTTTGTSKGQWYLPAAGELYASIVTNYSAVNSGLSAAGGTQLSSGYYCYWSSSEYSSSYAWVVSANGGPVYGYIKNYNDADVRCVLGFEDNGDGTGTLCGNDYLYTCTVGDDTHITGGVGTACGGKYTACTCASGYEWKDGACVLSCDSSYKYTCSGTNIAGGSGTACGGKYQSCLCNIPYTWSNGACTCSTAYKYTCSGTGYSGGSGTACGGKYTSCTCASGYEWKNGTCEKSCDDTCSVGNILYSDYTCSSCNVSGKTAIGVISYASGSTRLAIQLNNPGYMSLTNGYVDLPGIDNIVSSSVAKADYEGKAHTSAWVDYYGGSVTNNALGYCYNYMTTGTSKGQWYLPAAGELYASIVTNYSAVNSGLSAAGGTAIQGGYYWSSSEYSDKYAWVVYANGGSMSYGSKLSDYLDVRCVLGFEDNGDGTGTLCGNDYLYTCTVGDDTHITGGVGTACGGKYTACSCADGYEWKNGVCEQAVVCEVGNILNSDMTCSASKVSGKTPIGVVSYISGSTRLAINLVNREKEWGGHGRDISGLKNYSSSSTAKNDFSGKSNTSKIVNVLGSSSTSYAAGYCYNYTTAGTSKGDWYLPAQGELYATVWTNKTAVNNGLSAAGGTAIQGGYHWSSSEANNSYAWSVYAYAGGMTNNSKDYNYGSVRCVLAF